MHRLDSEEYNRAVPEFPMSTSSEPMSRVNGLLAIARSGSSRDTAPVATQPDYIELPYDSGDEATFYTLDTTPGAGYEPHMDTQCPPHLDDMLKIVRELRQTRMNTLHNAHALVTPATEERRSAKENANNFNRTNLSDFF